MKNHISYFQLPLFTGYWQQEINLIILSTFSQH